MCLYTNDVRIERIRIRHGSRQRAIEGDLEFLVFRYSEAGIILSIIANG